MANKLGQEIVEFYSHTVQCEGWIILKNYRLGNNKGEDITEFQDKENYRKVSKKLGNSFRPCLHQERLTFASGEMHQVLTRYRAKNRATTCLWKIVLQKKHTIQCL